MIETYNGRITPGQIVTTTVDAPDSAQCDTFHCTDTATYLWLDGTPMSGKKTHQVVRAGIARTFQNIRLFKQLTVEENVLVAFDDSFTYRIGAAIFRLPSFWKQEN